MTFVLLSRVLLWLLLAAIIVSLFRKFPGNFIGQFFSILLIIIVVLAFLNPGEPFLGELWRVVSFPLKPLGAAILLLVFAAQRIKDGGVGKPGGYLIIWALVILLLSSTPAFGYLLTRTPLAAAPSSDVLVAWNPETTTPNTSDVVGDSILSSTNIRSANIAFNPMNGKAAPYLLGGSMEGSSPRAVPRRLGLEAFVPNAQTLAYTTQVWDSYLRQIYLFLRPGR